MTTTPVKQSITVTINGKAYTKEIPTYRTLVDFIRYDVGLTGTKEACSVGVCGACTIEMDGNNSMNEWFGGDWNQVPFDLFVDLLQFIRKCFHLGAMFGFCFHTEVSGLSRYRLNPFRS